MIQKSGIGMRLAMAGLVILACALALGTVHKIKMGTHLGQVQDKIAIVPVDGELKSPDLVVDLLHRYREDVPGVKAVVLAIDSPGGGVATAQEIVEAIKSLQEKGIYVVASMGSTAASGAYYISAPCDKIVADPGTLTGSIGVILESWDASKVLNKVGLDFQVIKSGQYKDAGSFARPFTASERHLFQGIIDDVYNQFLDVVVHERRTPLRAVLAKERHENEGSISDAEIRAYVKSFADGRVFSGRQAMAYGLVDQMGGLSKAIDVASDLAGVANPDIVTYREPKSFAEMLTGISKVDLRSWAQSALGADTTRFGFYAW